MATRIQLAEKVWRVSASDCVTEVGALEGLALVVAVVVLGGATVGCTGGATDTSAGGAGAAEELAAADAGGAGAGAGEAETEAAGAGGAGASPSPSGTSPSGMSSGIS